jgi:hypothetical protein
VAALVAAWILGVGGVTNGCGMLQFYRQSTHPAVPADARMSPELRAKLDAVQKARVEALGAHSGRMVPLAAADVLLSSLLIVACARALAARPGAHALALQALGANAAFAVVDFVLSRPVRWLVIDAAMRPTPGAGSADLPPTSLGWWFYRVVLAVQLVVFGLAAFALTRPRVMAAFGDSDSEEE